MNETSDNNLQYRYRNARESERTESRATHLVYRDSFIPAVITTEKKSAAGMLIGRLLLSAPVTEDPSSVAIGNPN
jgi:hypothetical protein